MKLSSVLSFSQYAKYLADGTKIEGWFSDMSAALFDAFLCFQSARNARGDFLEIGIAYGKAALMMAMHAGREDVIRLVDVSPQHVDATTAMIKTHVESEVVGIQGYSEALPLDLFPSRSTRFMHIDGDHGLWALHNDLDIADRVLGPDGVVVLDDFLAPQFIGVTIGAIQWMTQHPQSLEMVLVGFNKAYLVRRRVAQDYYVFIRDILPGFLRANCIDDFTFSRTDIPKACATFGITQRQFDVDFVTREFATGLPEVLVDGKIVV